MFILLVKKEFPILSCAKHIYFEINSIFSVPSTTATPTTTPTGKQFIGFDLISHDLLPLIKNVKKSLPENPY